MTTTVISASAGAGKTYSLTEKLVEAIRDRGVRPEAVVAITYTNKAAAELARRLRRRLLDEGMAEHAARVRDGYLGTVHSVCQRMLADLAFEAGLSPFPTVAPEAWLSQVSSDVVGRTLGPVRMERLLPRVDAMGLAVSRHQRFGRSYDWRTALSDLLAAARENGLGAPAFAEGAEGSVDELLGLLPAPANSGAQGSLNERLLLALGPIRAFVSDEAQAELDTKGKLAGTTQKRQRWLASVSRTLEAGRRPSWSTLSEARSLFKPKKYTQAAAELLALFDAHTRAPAFHDDLEQTIREVFGAAGEVQAALQARKQQERILDFSDMLADAARLLKSPAARTRFEGNLDLLMVDEFQDTSPVQLEVISQLASMARETVWVGDGKQAIFGFQGSDPELMKAATAAVLDGRAPETRDRSYRSRPALVELASEVFVRALDPHGFPEEQVRLHPACPESPALEALPVVQLWNIHKPEGDRRARVYEGNGIARQVRRLVDEGLPVRRRGRPPQEVAETRPVRFGDIAVLARTNHECRQIAQRLEHAGVPSRVAEQGLGETEEAWLLRAGLALLADPGDSLAAAELCWLVGDVDDPAAWLTARIEKRAAARAEGRQDVAFAADPAVQAVRALASAASQLTPEEAVLAVFEALDVHGRVLSWPDPRRRLANLEALRAVARTYEDTCAAQRSAATVAGLVGHLSTLATETAQAMPTAENAVRVLTYHKSKGLEWPVVVCANLGKRFADAFFEVRVQPAPSFDASAPLAGRALRWFPWPYGGKSANLELADLVGAQPFAEAERQRRREERARLLYVGTTRARDHLVLCRAAWDKGATDWLDELVDDSGAPVLALPWDEAGRQELTLGDRSWSCEVHQVLGTDLEPVGPPPHTPTWFTAPAGPVERSPQAVRPSELGAAPESPSIADRVHLGDRLALRCSSERMADVGNALHGFFVADPGPESPGRRAVAARLVDHHGLSGMLAPEVALEASDRLRRWLAAHAPGPRLAEWPVRQRLPGGRYLSGEIDLLVPLARGWLLLDHKSFPGTLATRDARLGKWAAQLAAYQEAVEAATARPVVQTWIHLPIRGELMRIESSQPEA